MNTRHIVCPNCNSTNRVPDDKDALQAKCGKCSEVLFSGKVHEVTSDQFRQQIEKSSVPVVADFWADWCQPCKVLAPVMARAAAEMEPAYRFVKIDTDKHQMLAGQYAIRGIPTLIIFRDGKEISRQSGAMDLQSLKSWISTATR